MVGVKGKGVGDLVVGIRDGRDQGSRCWDLRVVGGQGGPGVKK